jgi:hypothetical protein
LIEYQNSLKNQIENLQINENLHFGIVETKFQNIETKSTQLHAQIEGMNENQKVYSETHSKFHEENKKEFGFEFEFSLKIETLKIH